MTADARTQELAANLARVQEKIASLCVAYGREPAQLLPVTKLHPLEDLARLQDLGIMAVGENREQEARAKAAALPAMNIHMIGQVQSKKANSVARWAAAVHSVDSLKLIQALNRGVERAERAEPLPCFLQLSFDGDPARGGVGESELSELVDAALAAPHLAFAGLMVVPPLGEDPEAVFSWARELLDQYRSSTGQELRLSAGMSADLEAALKSGSDLVRVGTEIMGKRPVA